MNYVNENDPVPFNKTETSKLAASKVNFSMRSKIGNSIMSYLATHENGAIAEELSIRLSVDSNSIRPALLLLEKKGFVKRDGTKRKTKANNYAFVYKASFNTNSNTAIS